MNTKHDRGQGGGRTARPRGESLVWLSSAGLALGVLMVLLLLALVVREGVSVFWPKRVGVITLREDAPSRLGDSDHIAGSIIRKQANPRSGEEEWQLYIGNKDAYGTMFRYIDASDMESVNFPESIVVAERLEYGKAIFHPLSMTTIDGRRIEASSTTFWPELNTALREVRHRFREISRLERKEIGALNRRVNKLALERRHIERQAADGGSGQPSRLSAIDEKLSVLDEEYRILAAEARELRELQKAGSLEYRIPTGQVRTQPLGEFLNIFRPNTMGILQKGSYFLSHIWSFLSERPREANTEGGIFPAIFGTFIMTVLMSIVVMPFGVMAAIYLREYARQGVFVQCVRIAVNNLAGVPSIVYGVFGLGFFVYFIGGTIDQLFFSQRLPTATFGTGGILWASLTLALMTVPVVVVATEEALAAVPRGAREASLACGASKWQTIQRIVLPASAPGILTGLILAMARGAGEVAPLMIVGVVKLAPSLPVDTVWPFFHLERKFMHLGFHIYDLGFQSPDSEAARPMVFATTLLLITLVILLNLGAIIIRNHLRKKYKTSTF